MHVRVAYVQREYRIQNVSSGDLWKTDTEWPTPTLSSTYNIQSRTYTSEGRR